MLIKGKRVTCYRKTQVEIRGLNKAAASICMPQTIPVRERVNSQKRNTRDHRQMFGNIFPST